MKILECRIASFGRVIDQVLEQLQDEQWHSINEINKIIELPPDKLNLLAKILQELGIVYIREKELKITELGLKFLKLST